MRNRWMLAATLLISSCAIVKTTSLGTTLILKPLIQAGSYTTKTVVNPYTQASINHLILKLYTFDGTEHDQGIQKSIPNADLGKSITFTNLKASTTYRIKALAYASTDESALISTTDASSSTDVILTNDDRPTLASLKVQLINQPFNGQGTSSLQVTNGGYTYSSAESLFIPYVVTTVAGNGGSTFTDGTGTSATFNCPHDVAEDGLGNLYVADLGNSRIRKIDTNGVVTTVAGNGNATFADGTGTSASFRDPRGLVVDGQGNIYVADYNNNRIRKIDTNARVTTVAGNGNAAFADGTGTSASFKSPTGIVVDASGNLYVADNGNNRIRKIDTSGIVTTVAGNGGGTWTDGTGTSASFQGPTGIALGQGNLYITEWSGNRIRKIDTNGVVTTVAGNGNATFTDGTGTSASFNCPEYIAVDGNGILYVADRGNNRIRKISSAGAVTTVSGNGINTFADGMGTSASFNCPIGIAVDGQGNIYVGDAFNNRIRRIR